MKTLVVNAKALEQVLQALNGPGHLIRELQATRGLHELTGDNPIEVLVENYNAELEAFKASTRERQ